MCLRHNANYGNYGNYNTSEKVSLVPFYVRMIRVYVLFVLGLGWNKLNESGRVWHLKPLIVDYFGRRIRQGAFTGHIQYADRYILTFITIFSYM